MAVTTRIETSAQYEVALARADELWGSKPGTPENVEFSNLADAVSEYESRMFLQNPTDCVDALEFELDRGKATLDEVLQVFGSESAFVEYMFRARQVDSDTAQQLSDLLELPLEDFTCPFRDNAKSDDVLIGGTEWRERLAAMRDTSRKARAA